MSAMLEAEIQAAMREPALERRLIVTPVLDPVQQFGPGTIDLRLGTEFLDPSRPADDVLDPIALGKRNRIREERRVFVPLGDTYVLPPGGMVLGSTLEFVGMPYDMHGQVLSRSSWGRIGLLVATAVVVQPGFRGMLTLELVNTGNAAILLRPGLRVAQLQLWRGPSPVQDPYGAGNKYVTPLGPEGARLHREARELERLQDIGDSMNGRRGRH